MKSITNLNIVDEMLLKKMSGGGGSGEIEMKDFFHQTLSYGATPRSKTLDEKTTIAVIVYPWAEDSRNSYPAPTAPTITGEYTLIDQATINESHWVHMFCNVKIISKKKGDANVTVNFQMGSEHYYGYGFVVEF